MNKIKRGYSTAFKNQSYRFYDKEIYYKFKEKLFYDRITFQDFVTSAIEEYLNGNYIPKVKGGDED